MYEVFTIIGCALVVFLINEVLWDLLQGLRAHVLPYMSDCFKINLKEKYGSWAVVTGSTDGIGKAYAIELAKRGINIVLVSRSEPKLIKVATEIQTMYEVKTKIVCADFSKGQAIFEKIKEDLKGIQIGILVNNVGKNLTYPTYLNETSEQELWDIININIGATVFMSRLVIPQMLARKKGAIVNVSSSAELQPLPLMTVYAASKAFVKSFSDALRVEYAHRGLTIQHLSPFFVNTKMNAFSHRLQEDTLFVPAAYSYSENAVNTLGVVNHSTGYWSHGFQYFITSNTPVWLCTQIGNFMNRTFRRDYLQKAEIRISTQ